MTIDSKTVTAIVVAVLLISLLPLISVFTRRGVDEMRVVELPGQVEAPAAPPQAASIVQAQAAGVMTQPAPRLDERLVKQAMAASGAQGIDGFPKIPIPPPDNSPATVEVKIANLAVGPDQDQPSSAHAVIKIRANERLPQFFLTVVTAGNLAADGNVDGLRQDRVAGGSLFGLEKTSRLRSELKNFDRGGEQTINLALKVRPNKGSRGAILANVSAPITSVASVAAEDGGEVNVVLIERPRFSLDAVDLCLIEGGMAHSGASSFHALRMRDLVARSSAANAPGADVSRSVRDLLFSGGDGTSQVASDVKAEGVPAQDPDFGGDPQLAMRTHGPAVSTTAPKSITVKGQIEFEDAEGKPHPLPHVTVQIWKGTSIDPDKDTKVSETVTDASGRFSEQISAPDDGSKSPFYIQIAADGETVQVLSYDTNRLFVLPWSELLKDGSRKTYEEAGAGDEITFRLKTKFDTRLDHPNGSAFSIYAAATAATRYLEKLGLPRPTGKQKVYLYYPVDHGGAWTDTDTANPAIVLPLSDAGDWDVIMHEYGHHVQKLYKGSDLCGGPHDIDENLCNTVTANFHKIDAIRLAWQEGWATFFGIMAQAELGLKALGIKYVGDTAYTDRKLDPNVNSLQFDLATNSSPISLGEGHEVAVARVLWNFLIGGNAPGGTRDTLSSGEIWELTCKPAWSFCFSDFWDKLNLRIKKDGARRARYGTILARMGMGPRPTLPGDRFVFDCKKPLELQWEMARLGPNKDDEAGCEPDGLAWYVVHIYDASYANELYKSEKQTDTTLRIDPDVCRQILRGKNGDEIRWYVVRTGKNPPTTGDYVGNAWTIIDQSH